MIDRLGQRILKKGLISRDDLSQAIERQRLSGGRIGFNLMALNLVTESELTGFFKFRPPATSSVKDTNLEVGFITDLILKHCIFLKNFTIAHLSNKLKLPSATILDIITELRRNRFIEVAKGDISLLSSEYAITSSGINRATQALEQCRYVGPAPVSLEDYKYAIEVQTVKCIEITEEHLTDAFANIVLNKAKIRTFGSAITSAKPIFLYGPPGNGKTTIAESIGHSLPGEVYIPHSVLAGNQVIVVYDQVNHRSVDPEKDNQLDQRWIRIKRPVVISGGELSLKTLDLNYNPNSKYYEAPLQMKANNGLFIVDDFGRQIVDPQTLLNRWIIPLDRQTDFLTLHTGMKFEIPFDQLVIFATNLPPGQIADNAFLRRLRYKIRLDYATVEDFRKVFKRICNSNNIQYDETVFNYLMEKYRSTNTKLAYCQPRDLIDQIIDSASFEGKPPVLTTEAIDKAWENYFVFGS